MAIRLDQYGRFRSTIALRQLREVSNLSAPEFAARLTSGSGIPFSLGMYEQWESSVFDPPPSVRRVAESLAFDRHLVEFTSSGLTGIHEHSVGIDQELWADDLQRSAEYLDRQQFDRATALLARWLAPARPDRLDDETLYLRARSLTLLGDALRDQGKLVDAGSAPGLYREALRIVHQLGIPRRIAQLELYLTVMAEMDGRLGLAISRYEALAGDDRLGPRDRARARLWVGTALSKRGDHQVAVHQMEDAAHQFERLQEPDDWSVAQQKLALAHRGAGRLDVALHHIDVASRGRDDLAPLQRVRLDAAHAHILVSDPPTRKEGLALLDCASELAARYGLDHQLRSIHTIRRQTEFATH